MAPIRSEKEKTYPLSFAPPRLHPGCRTEYEIISTDLPKDTGKQNAEKDTPIDIAPTTILKSMLNIWKLHPMDLLSYFRKFNNVNRKFNLITDIGF